MKKSFVFTLFFMFILTSCNKDIQPTVGSLGSGSCSASPTGASADALFKIGDLTVSKKDLSSEMKQFIYKNEFDAYSKNQMMIKELALRVHLAKQQNKLKDLKSIPPLDELIPVSKISIKDAKAFFNQNKNRMPPHTSFDKMKVQITKYLEGQQISKVFQQKMLQLERNKNFTSLVAVPVAPVLKIETSSFASLGDKNAKVQIIEISDYLCGHCQQAHSTVKQLLKHYKNKIHFTQINFSLRPPGLSGTYARGAYCAQVKGNNLFWKFHHAAFKKTTVPHDHSAAGHDHSAEQNGDSKEAIEKVSSVAKSIGLNMTDFKKCLNSNASRDFVSKTNKLISEQGINSTPVFIVNGKKLERGISELEQAIKSSSM